METLINSILNIHANLAANLSAYAKGNKSAGKRARKNTMELERLYKQFRKESVSNDQHPAAV